MGPKANKTDIAKIKQTLKWHWIVATVYGAALVGLVTWYLPKELNTQRKQIFADVKLEIAKVLDPALQKLVLPEDKIPGASVAELRKRYQEPASTIGNALSVAVPSNSSALDPLRRFIQTSLETRSLPEAVRTSGLSALIHVYAYSDFSQDWLENKHYYIIGERIENFGTAIKVKPQAMGRAVVYNSKIVNAGNQELAGVKWIKTTFERTKVTYRHGDVFLADVGFHDCTFDFGASEQSQALLVKLQGFQAAGKPVTILYLQNNKRLSNIGMVDP